MDIRASVGPLAEQEAGLVVVSLSHRSQPSGAAAELDAALGGPLSRSVKDGAYRAGALDLEWVYPAGGTRAGRVLAIGEGKPDAFDARALRRMAAVAVRQARRKAAGTVLLALGRPAGMDAEAYASAIADGAVSGLYDSSLYKRKDDLGDVTDVLIHCSEADAGAVTTAIARGQAIGEATVFARKLADEPANIMTTVRFAEETQKMADERDISVEPLGADEMSALGMNALMAVASASQYPPITLVLSYNGGSGPTLGLVGKGVVFDSGGISIKPAADMHYMKYDMGGAATVVATMRALADLKAPVNVIGVVGLVENVLGGRGFRPGDVYRAANGKTIEIISTDAEGRLVLADCLDLAIKRGAERLVDVATLTGAMGVALADVATGFFAKPESWAYAVQSAADRAAERAWRFPLFPEYNEKIKSSIADLQNSGGRLGGAINAAVFLEHFVGDTPWAHLDIAGTVRAEKDMPWQSKGASGVMVRTLIELAAPSR